MSKYYKAEDVTRAIAEQLCWEARTEYGDKFTTEDWLEEAEDYVSDLPTIEVSEDCISREYLKSLGYINKGDFNSVETIREWIDNAPSVVPTVRKNRTVEQSCDTCKHNKLEWFSEECDGCTKANSNYEPTAEQSSMVGEWITHYETYEGSGEIVAYGVECPFCGRWEEYKEPFCNCGAKMRLE